MLRGEAAVFTGVLTLRYLYRFFTASKNTRRVDYFRVISVVIADG